MVEISSGGVGDTPVVGTWLVERGQTGRCDVLVARAVVCPTGSTVPLRVFNPHKEAVRLGKGLKITQMEPLDKDPPITSDAHLLTISAVTEVSPSSIRYCGTLFPIVLISVIQRRNCCLCYLWNMLMCLVFTLIWDAQTSQNTTLTQVTLNPSINCPVVSPQPAARK